MRTALPLLTVALCLSLAAEALAQQASPPAATRSELTPAQLRDATDVASSVMSPFCPGRTLEACPSPRAGDWRGEIREMIAKGVPKQQIIDTLQARVPKINITSDKNRLYGWVVPLLAIVVISLLILFIGRMALKRRAAFAQAEPAEPAGAAAIDDASLSEYEQLLERELKKD